MSEITDEDDTLAYLNWSLLVGQFCESSIQDLDIQNALQSEDRDNWIDAVKKEWQSLVLNKTWTVEDVPETDYLNILKTRWLLKIKRKADGTYDKHKARLVVKGYDQIYGVDFTNTCAPVAAMTTVRTVLALIAHNDLEADQIDISSAFLQASLKDDVYIHIPEGFDYGEPPPHCKRILKLQKSLYGIKQAPYEWNKCLDEFLVKDSGFQACQSDRCLYLRQNILLVVFVDDIVIAYHQNYHEEVQTFKKNIQSRFPVTDLGPIHSYRGMNIERDRSNFSLSISQNGYVDDILNKFKMKLCKGISTLGIPGNKLDKGQDDEEKLSESFNYRALVGSLMYLSVMTRPDISHAVVELAKHVSDPATKHWIAGKRVLRYLKDTKSLGLRYSRDFSDELMFTSFVDAGFADCPMTRRSTSGCCFMFANAAISWFARSQKSISRSSFEAELISLSEALLEIRWLRRLFSELGISQSKPTIVHEDNQAVISQILEPQISRRTKHIELKYFYAREMVHLKEIEVKYLPSTEQIADGFTKNLGPQKFTWFRQRITGSRL